MRSRQQIIEYAWWHLNELREAWRTGALDERDDKGGMRSNRNADVEVSLRELISDSRLRELSDMSEIAAYKMFNESPA